MKFIADEMLGKLAKWLRFLGYDTVYAEKISDAEIILQAKDEDRIILTRDHDFLKRSYDDLNVIFIKYDKIAEQLTQLRDELELKSSLNMFSRCSECNRELKVVDRDFVKDRVPPFIISTHESFKFCPGCNRVYWEGTHMDRINKLIKEVFGE